MAFKMLDVKRGALVHGNGQYRNLLTREWHSSPRRVNPRGVLLWVMLNPSTGDADNDDPTIRRCMTFAELWGFESIVIENAYNYRTSDPAELRAAGYPSSQNHLSEFLFPQIEHADMICAAWGTNVQPHMHFLLASILPEKKSYALGLTGNGYPVHPLYQPSKLTPTPWPHNSRNRN